MVPYLKSEFWVSTLTRHALSCFRANSVAEFPAIVMASIPSTSTCEMFSPLCAKISKNDTRSLNSIWSCSGGFIRLQPGGVFKSWLSARVGAKSKIKQTGLRTSSSFGLLEFPNPNSWVGVNYCDFLRLKADVLASPTVFGNQVPTLEANDNLKIQNRRIGN